MHRVGAGREQAEGGLARPHGGAQSASARHVPPEPVKPRPAAEQAVGPGDLDVVDLMGVERHRQRQERRRGLVRRHQRDLLRFTVPTDHAVRAGRQRARRPLNLDPNLGVPAQFGHQSGGRLAEAEHQVAVLPIRRAGGRVEPAAVVDPELEGGPGLGAVGLRDGQCPYAVRLGQRPRRVLHVVAPPSEGAGHGDALGRDAVERRVEDEHGLPVGLAVPLGALGPRLRWGQAVGGRLGGGGDRQQGEEEREAAHGSVLG